MGIDSLGSLFLLEIKFERIEKGKNKLGLRKSRIKGVLN
jgi:hypothetical protein